MPYAMTNKGLHISLRLIPNDFNENVFLAPLKCFVPHSQNERKGYPAIYLKRKVVGSVESYSRIPLSVDGNVVFWAPKVKLEKLKLKATELENYERRYIYVKEDSNGLLCS